MTSSLYELLERLEQHARTDREKGTYFEELAKVYFEHDDIQKQHYDKVWSFSDWAAEQGLVRKDTGIDLVARLREDPESFCAIQCKFYEKNHRLQRGDLDSFFTASSRKPFTRRILIDTTEVPLGANAQAILDDGNQYVETYRISLRDLEESRIDWTVFNQRKEVVLRAKKKLRQHQEEALAAVREGLDSADRGKLIMACGTGKTFTGLKIAEDLAGAGKRVLFMVPSLALMSQTVTEWSNDSAVPLRSFAACSDSQVGKRRASDDIADLQQHDLAFPATTDPAKLAAEANQGAPDAMTVVFSTYQSIQVISDAQKHHGLPEFDLIICDEAHRTTGVTLAGENESNFVRIHDNRHVQGKKRLYMTATPRIYGEGVKGKADEGGHELCSMDRTDQFGEVLFYRGFSWAVENDLLTDYKVIILAMDENLVAKGVQRALSAGTNELQLDDASKIVGCYKALTKVTLKDDIQYDQQPMRRALAFCRDIKSSKLIENQFVEVVEEYLNYHADDYVVPNLHCAVEHVDGTFNAKERNRLLDWLKAEPAESECRILTNARCLSEGVDVPALDAIMFLHPRKSQIDVVQSVGRVMRKAGPDKRMGYVILPIGVPHGVSPEQALNDNEKYKVVWQILNALRAHDERFDATINKASLGEKIDDKIQVVGVNSEELRSVTAEVDALPARNNGNGSGKTGGADLGGEAGPDGLKGEPDPQQFGFNFNEEVSDAILARIVKKCGTRDYWEDWANNIAEIAHKHIARIKATLESETNARSAFDEFLAELRDDLNDSITEDEAIEMLAQHVITRPVFETLFEGHQFTLENPVSKAIQRILDILDEHHIDKESASLENFYASVRRRAAGIQTSQGKQRLVVELYDKFFRNAFPRLTQRLGIVYTPVEVVDFIIHSVNDVLRNEFGQTLGSEGVHIIDPFTGTGTFITRLLQSGLIKPEEMAHKYKHEIHANEIVLLAYYIAAINIEAVYHDLTQKEYTPFEGICLTDTFQMYEKDDLVSGLLADNSERRKRQKELDLKVIIGNPPYSAGQTSANDNNANLKYPHLDQRIGETYSAHTKATNKNALYDSYIRAIRWGSDRLGEKGGVMAYVSNAGWVDGNAMDGLRKCLTDEFSSLYVFHLRGNQRTSGELSRKEGGKIFGSGSRAPIAITVFVKNPEKTKHGQIYFHDIGDYLNREDKLNIVQNFGSVNGISAAGGWQQITPDKHNDWLGQRDNSFDAYLKMGDKKDKSSNSMFENYSRGLETGRDAWCINSSINHLSQSIVTTIETYNHARGELAEHTSLLSKEKLKIKIDADITHDPKLISWTSSLKQKLINLTPINYSDRNFVTGLYRPFSKQWFYFDSHLNHRTGQLKGIFPEKGVDNRLIVLKQRWSGDGQFALMSDCIFELQPDGGTQCFPLKLYELADDQEVDLFSNNGDALDGYTVKDGITDEGLQYFQKAYPEELITKEDLFYYVYGLLHSDEYRERFADNLSKELPRIPAVKQAVDFWAFSEAGRKLADLHVNYEQVDMYQVGIKITGKRDYEDLTDADFRVDKKWKFGGTAKDKDKSIVKYNSVITMTGIPVEAYEYVVNGKPALEWIMERQVVKTDKASGIVNDANDYAVETMGNPAYPLELFRRVITVSLETMKIVKNLPALDI